MDGRDGWGKKKEKKTLGGGGEGGGARGGRAYPRRDGVDEELERLAALVRVNLHQGLRGPALLDDHDEHLAECYGAQEAIAQAETTNDLFDIKK